MNRRRSKAKCQEKHARSRALERYALDLSGEDLLDMVAQIQDGRGTFIMRQSHRVSLFAVTVRGELVPVVYDRNRKTIVTVLPRAGYIGEDGKVIR